MPEDIQGIIESQTYAIESLRLDSAFAVPIYQRPYEWQRDMTRRFATDLLDGAARIGRDPKRIDYIGSLITARTPDNDLDAVGDPPPMPVHTLVDGQQRLTTLAMLAVALRDNIDLQLRIRPLDSDSPLEGWLRPHVEDTRSRLLELCAFRTPGTDIPPQPRLIRMNEDRWSFSGTGSLTSPVSTLLSQYVDHASDPSRNDIRFRYSPPNHNLAAAVTSGPGDFRHLQLRFDDTYQLVKWLRNGDRNRDDGIPSSGEFLTEEFKEPGWFSSMGLQASPELRPALINQAINDDEFASIFRLFLVSRFMLTRTVVSWARAKHEDQALEMFDALNTTGTPLTAIACFKPVVVSSFASSDEFLTSQVGNDFKALERRLSTQANSDRRRNMARDLVTVFELAESGRTVGSKLPDQRQALRDTFSMSRRQGEAQETIRLLRRSAEFLFQEWEHPERTAVLEPGNPLSSEAGFALALLSDSKHTVVQGLLARFFHAYHAREISTESWLKTLRAVGAFWVLWRAANEGRYPDAFYRSLMAGSTSEAAEDLGFNRAHGTAPDLATLVERLVSQLDYIHAGSEDDWIGSALTAPIYDRQKQVARAILLAASHGRIHNSDSPGTLEAALEADETAWLRWERWSGPSTATLEHVAPVNPERHLQSSDEAIELNIDAWDRSFYVAERVHEIGNLTLLPIEENSSVSNRDWEEKRIIYKALSQPTQYLTEQVLNAEGAHLPQGLKDNLLTRGTYATIPVLASLVGIDEFDLNMARTRGEDILRSAYSVLRSWLEA